MTKLMAYYRELRDEFLSDHTVCAVHGGNCVATEVHHTKGRARTLLIDARWWKAVCSGGHAWIHDQIATARAEGFLCAKGDWNKSPWDLEAIRLAAIMQSLTK
jgi:hypothetical protein